MTNIMAKVHVNSTKKQLGRIIDERMPDDLPLSEQEAWMAEKLIALREWNADLPSLESLGTPCSGGPLVTAPISDAKPSPLGPPGTQLPLI